MSVVNKMLRDLEARERQQAINANYVPEKSIKHWVLIGAVLMVSASVAATYAVSTAFVPDTNTGKDEAKETHVEKLPTDRYAVTDQELDDLSTEQKLVQIADTESLDLTERLSLKDYNAKHAKGESIGDSEVEVITKTTGQFDVQEQEISAPLVLVEKTPTELLVVDSHINPHSGSDVNAPDYLAGNEVHKLPKVAIKNEIEAKSLARFEINRQAKAVAKPTAEPAQILTVRPSNGSKQELSNLRSQAHIESRAGNNEKVIQILNEILILAPSDQKTRKQLAALLFSKVRVQEASKVLREGLELAPAESSLRLMLARTYFKSGNVESAFEVLSQHPYQKMASDDLLSLRAALAEKLGLYAEAQNDYQALVNRNPMQAKWWLGLGVSQDKQKLVVQALDSYQQAKALNQLPVQVDSFVSKRIQLLTRES